MHYYLYLLLSKNYQIPFSNYTPGRKNQYLHIRLV